MRPDNKCRSCGAPIRWAFTAAGKRIPLDPEPYEAGNVWVDHYESGMPVVNVAADRRGVPSAEALVYVSHFVTCPNAAQHRRARSA